MRQRVVVKQIFVWKILANTQDLQKSGVKVQHLQKLSGRNVLEVQLLSFPHTAELMLSDHVQKIITEE